MSRKRSSLSGHVARFLILLLLPVVVLGLMAGWVVLNRPGPATGPVSVTLERDIIPPLGETVATLRIDPTQLTSRTIELDDTDVVLVLDHSGSMVADSPVGLLLSDPDSPMEKAKDAASILVTHLCGEAVRFGIVQFDDSAQVLQPLSADTDSVSAAIQSIGTGGGTSFVPAMEQARQVLDGGRPGVRQVVVFLSDGDATDTPAAKQAAARLRDSGVEVFTIGLGYGVNRDDLTEMAGGPDRYLETVDPSQMTSLFLGVAEEIAEAAIKGMVVKTRFGPYLFDIEEVPGGLVRSVDHATGEVEWGVPVAFTKPVDLPVRLDPDIAGLYRAPSDPILVQYYDENQQRKTIQANTRPWLLVWTIPLLLLLFLPALTYPLLALAAWLVEGLRRSPREGTVDPGAGVINPSMTPAGLARLRPSGVIPSEAVPTLVIGLGRTGRWVLTHIKSDLVDTFKADERDKVQLLQLDCAREEYLGSSLEDVRVAGAALDGRELVLLPREACRLEDDVRREPAAHTGWLRPADHADTPANLLDVSRGSRGDRVLARLGLWKDLEEGAGSEVHRALESALDRLMAAPAPDRNRQVILVHSAEGGVGSGWANDIARLVTEGIRSRQAVEPGLVPPRRVQIVLSVQSLLTGASREAAERANSNRVGLLRECDRLSLAGRYPHTHYLAGPGGPRAQALSEQLTDQRFYLTTDRRADGPAAEAGFLAEAADLVGILANRNVNREVGRLLDGALMVEAEQLLGSGHAPYGSAGTHAVVFPTRQLRDKLLARFLQDAVRVLVRARGEGEHMLDAAGHLATSMAAEDHGRRLAMAVSGGGGPAAAPLVQALSGGALQVVGDAPPAAPTGNGPDILSLPVGQVLRSRELGLADLYHLLRVVHDAPGLSAEARQVARHWTVQAERWLVALVGPSAIPHPVEPVGDAGSDGLFMRAAGHRADTVRAEAELSRIPSRHYLWEDRGNPDLREDAAYRRWMSRWLGTEDVENALAQRLWFESVTGAAGAGLQLVFMGDSLSRINLTDGEGLERGLRGLAEQWLDSLSSLSIYDKLLGEDGDAFVPPAELARQLSRSRVALSLRIDKTEQDNFLVLPTPAHAPQRDFARALAREVSATLAIEESVHALVTADRRSVRTLSVVHGWTSRHLDNTWDERGNFVEQAERLLDEITNNIGRRAMREPPVLSPAVAMVAVDTARLALFATAWITGALDDPEEGLLDYATRFVLGEIGDPIAGAGPPLPERISKLKVALGRYRSGMVDLDSPLDTQLHLVLSSYCEEAWT